MMSVAIVSYEQYKPNENFFQNVLIFMVFKPGVLLHICMSLLEVYQYRGFWVLPIPIIFLSKSTDTDH